MKLVALLALAISASALPEHKACFKRAAHREEHVLSPRPHEVAGFDAAALPAAMDWRTSAPGKVPLVTISRNQHIPNYCGACWSFAATSSLSDRYRIMNQAAWPQVDLSMQVVLNCDLVDNGCHGGDFAGAHKYIHEAGGLPDETCQSYEATGHDTGNNCTDLDICRNCDPKKGCFATPKYNKWQIEEYGTVNGTVAMQAEIAARGPIACAIAVTPALIAHSGDGVFVDQTGKTERDHAIQVAGWGTDAKAGPYWIIRNSWGTYWGDQGWFRLSSEAGHNLGIADCAWATPANGGKPVLHTITADTKAPASEAIVVKPEAAAAAPAFRYTDPDVPCRSETAEFSVPEHQRITQPLPHTYLDAAALPTAWDWRNANGTDYTTWNKNQPE